MAAAFSSFVLQKKSEEELYKLLFFLFPIPFFHHNRHTLRASQITFDALCLYTIIATSILIFSFNVYGTRSSLPSATALAPY